MLMSAEDYRESLRALKPRVFVQGRQVITQHVHARTRAFRIHRALELCNHCVLGLETCTATAQVQHRWPRGHTTQPCACQPYVQGQVYGVPGGGNGPPNTGQGAV